MQGSSVARGLAIVALAAVAVVGARAGWLLLPRAPAPAMPVCATPVELETPAGVRVACATGLSCTDLRAGDRVSATCRIERGGMSARARLLVGVGIDVNQAPAADLALLDGIGPKLSEAIVAERERAPFSSVDDLLRVRGIGPTRLEAIRSHVIAQ